MEQTQYQIRIKRPADVIAKGTAPVCLVGPYPYKHQAERAIATWSMKEHSRTGIAGCVMTIEPYNPNDGEHLAGVLPLAPYVVAEELRAEGNSSTPFPDVWDRLSGVYSYEEAHPVYGAACNVIDAEAEEAEEEAQRAREREERIAPLRTRIHRAAARRRALYTAPALDLAAEMLADLHDAGARHGVDPDAWAMVGDLPGGCVNIVRSVWKPHRAELSKARMVALLGAAAERLRELGHPAERRRDRIELEVRDTTPTRGPLDMRWPLHVALTRDGGWELGCGATSGPMRAPVPIEAPYTIDGARAVADQVARFNAGELGGWRWS